MPSAPLGTAGPANAPRVRLDSWKEIADYLGKGERTVKRWESERGLPIHHVPGSGHGSVYAFVAELDEWLLSHKPRDSSTGAGSAPCEIGTHFTPQSSTKKSHIDARFNGAISRVRKLAPWSALIVVIFAAGGYFVVRHGSGENRTSLYSLHAGAKANASSNLNSEKQIAHDLYLRGRFEWNKRTPDSLNRALDYFTQAIVHDADSAESYVGLADTYDLLREYTMMPENEAYMRAIAAAKKAIQLDGSLAEAHRTLAFDEVWGNWDFATAQKEFQRAIELDPRDPITHLWFANAFAGPGWYEMSIREINRAQELDPTSHAILADKGLMLFDAGQEKQGLELVKQVEQTDPEFLSPHRYLAKIYMSQRDYPNFLMESEQAALLSHDEVLKDIIAAAKAGFHRDGERGLLNDLYLSQKKYYMEQRFPGTLFAATCARLGRKDEALDVLQQEYNRHSPTFLMIRQHPDLLALSNEPAYQKLLKKIQAP